jgi:hypothetical protein
MTYNSLFAQKAVKLDKGSEAPFSGILVTSEKLVELDQDSRKYLLLKDLSLTQEELIKYHRSSAKDYRERLSDAKFDSFLGNVGFFLLGTILAGVAFKISGKIGDI